MTPLTYNIKLYQGSTRRIRFYLRGETSGEVLDLQGRVVRLQARKTYTAAQTVLDMSTTNGSITIDEDNRVMITFTAEVTAAIREGEYVYDVEIENGPERDKPIRGKITVIPEVTR